MIKLGNTIRELRIARGLSQKKLAEESLLTASFLSLVENNRRDPSLTVLRRIAEALKVPEEAILWRAVPLPDRMKKEDRKLCEAAKLIVQRIMEGSGDADSQEKRGKVRSADNQS